MSILLLTMTSLVDRISSTVIKTVYLLENRKMAHEFETGFFVGEKAWHGLGTVLDQPPSIEEGLKLAGLDWQVREVPLIAEVNSVFSDQQDLTVGSSDATMLNMAPRLATHKAIVRNTDNRVLGVVGSGYQVFQNVEAFSFFDEVIQSGIATLETAMSLKQGSRIVVTAKIKGQSADIVNGDSVECYLALCHAFDGSLCLYIMFTPIRVVCNNTLTLAVNRSNNGRDPNVRLRHTSGMKDALALVKKSLDFSANAFSFTVDQYRFLAGKAINHAKLEKYVKDVLSIPENDATVMRSIDPITGMPTKLQELPRAYHKIMEAFEDQPGIQYGRGTFWQAYNAVTHYVDHIRGRNEETRFDASWFGEGKNIRDKALDVALTA